MKKLIIQLIFIMTYATVYAADGSKIVFFNGGFEQALEKAQSEGKLFMVDFYADWCKPCQWMDKMTYGDQELASYVNDNYIAVKVNIDDENGYLLKEQYEIQYLPTILIFNPKGLIIERIEETMNAESLLEVVKDHNPEDKKPEIVHAVNNSPRKSKAPIAKQANNPDPQRPKYDNYVKSRKTSTYKVLIGTYVNFEEAIDNFHFLRSKFVEPVLILNDVDGNDMVYKVLIGEYVNKEKAQKFADYLASDFNIESKVY